MSDVLTFIAPTSIGFKPAFQSMAFRPVGARHSWTSPPRSWKQKMADCSHGLFHKVDRGGATDFHHGARLKALCLEEHHYKV